MFYPPFDKNLTPPILRKPPPTIWGGLRSTANIIFFRLRSKNLWYNTIMPITTQWQPTKRMYGGIILGFHVRKTLGRGPRELPPPLTGCVIFRVRRGNGFYGSTAGKLYQDKYNYFVPSSINNPESATARAALTNAVAAWTTAMSDEEKAEYNKRASKGMHMSGYNLFVKEYIEAYF